MMNPFSWLQMTNMISYQGLVRTFPNPGSTRGAGQPPWTAAGCPQGERQGRRESIPTTAKLEKPTSGSVFCFPDRLPANATMGKANPLTGCGQGDWPQNAVHSPPLSLSSAAQARPRPIAPDGQARHPRFPALMIFPFWPTQGGVSLSVQPPGYLLTDWISF